MTQNIAELAQAGADQTHRHLLNILPSFLMRMRIQKVYKMLFHK